MSKYNNKTSKCVLKHVHDSIWEAEVCNYLCSLAQKKEIRGYSVQKSVDLTVKGKTICSHIVDFKVYKNNRKGSFWVEAKGLPTPTWQLKRKLTKALHPKIPYVTVYRGQLGLIDKEIS